MTNAQWFRCIDPFMMLIEVGRIGTTHRKCRLFCCAHCRCFFWQYMSPGVQRAIEVAEDYADQAASKYKLRSARKALKGYWGLKSNPALRASMAAERATSPSAPYDSAHSIIRNRNTMPWKGGKKAVAHLIRDVFGPPTPSDDSFSPIAFDRRWRTEDVLGLARGIYEDRAFDRLPLLADALMDAGCDSDDILSHCRSEGPHVRGCWVVDLILGKE